MIGLIGSSLFILLVSVIPYSLAIAMPNWRWLFGLTLIAMLVLAPEPSRRWMIGDVGPCGGLGFMLVLVGGAGLAIGVVVCGLTLLMRARGTEQCRIDRVRAVGTLIAPAVLIAPEVLTLSGLWPSGR
jgi:hypothetical protein